MKASWKDIALLGSVLVSIALLASYWHLWKERYPGFNVQTTLTITGMSMPDSGVPQTIKISGRGIRIEVEAAQSRTDECQPLGPPMQEPFYRATAAVGEDSTNRRVVPAQGARNYW